MSETDCGSTGRAKQTLGRPSIFHLSSHIGE